MDNWSDHNLKMMHIVFANAEIQAVCPEYPKKNIIFILFSPLLMHLQDDPSYIHSNRLLGSCPSIASRIIRVIHMLYTSCSIASVTIAVFPAEQYKVGMCNCCRASSEILRA